MTDQLSNRIISPTAALIKEAVTQKITLRETWNRRRCIRCGDDISGPKHLGVFKGGLPRAFHRHAYTYHVTCIKTVDGHAYIPDGRPERKDCENDEDYEDELFIWQRFGSHPAFEFASLDQ